MISSITLNNFQSHVKSTLNFSSGVNVIIGDTDSGKTAILRGLNWVVTNRPRGNSFVRKGSKSCSVLIKTETGSVERVKKPTFNGYRLSTAGFNGTLTEVGVSVPPEILPVIDLKEINTQSQLASHFIVGLSAGQTSKVFSELLGFEFADKLSSLVKSGSSQVGKDATRLADEVKILELKRSSFELKLKAKKPLLSCKKTFKDLEAASRAAETLSMLLDTYMEASLKVKKARNFLNALKDVDAIKKSFIELEGLVRKFGEYSNSLSKLKYSEQNLNISKSRFEKFVGFDEVNILIGSIGEKLTAVTDLSKSMSNIEALSVSVDSSNKKLVFVESELSAEKLNLDQVLDGMERCSECLREFTEESREAAKGLSN